MLLDDLKSRTENQHRKIEEQIDLFNRVRSIPAHASFLIGYYGFLLPLEEKLSKIPELDSDFNFEKRRKLPLLEKDFAFFRVSPGQRAEIQVWNAEEFCEPLSLSKAVGILYVLEGSTLGGKFITQRLKTELNLAENAGLSYYASYGDQRGEMWKAFRTTVEKLESAGRLDVEECIGAAIATFESLGAWMRVDRPFSG